MVWTKIPDDANEEPALVRLSDAAWRLYVAAVVDDNRQKTRETEHAEGVVSEARLTMIVPRYRSTALRELIAEGLLTAMETRGQYSLGGPLPEHQLSRDRLRKLREDRAKAGRDGALARWGDGKRHGNRDGSEDGKRDGNQDAPYPVSRNPEGASPREDREKKIHDALHSLRGYVDDPDLAAELTGDDGAEAIITQLVAFADVLAQPGEPPLTQHTQRKRIRRWLYVARADIEAARRRARAETFARLPRAEQVEIVRAKRRSGGAAALTEDELSVLPSSEQNAVRAERMAIPEDA